MRAGLTGIILVLAWGTASALPPDQVFERVHRSVWSLRALDASDKPLANGSALVIAPGAVVTSCRLLARAQKLEIRQGNFVYRAILEFPDVERDLCQLRVAGLAAAPLARGSAAALRPGQKVFVVGHLRSAEQALADGMVSSLRDAAASAPQVLTTVPAASGSLGAGLFDEEGRLAGMVTTAAKDLPGSVLAQPVEWLAEVAERGRAALARRASTATPAVAAPASPGLPGIGATYRYQWSERQFSRPQQEVSVRIIGVDGWNVSEEFKAGQAPAASAAVSGNTLSFLSRRLDEGQSLLEFAPYLGAQDVTRLLISGASVNYPADAEGIWNISIQQSDWDQVVVPAGTFRALRIQMNGSRHASASGAFNRAAIAERFQYTAWYAPDAKRLIKVRHQKWNAYRSPIADDHVELLEYKPG